VRLVPEISVDLGWRAFLMHTIEYTQFEQDYDGGRRLHHVSIMLEHSSSGAARRARSSAPDRPNPSLC
jgi:hypothetical protein